MGEGHIFTLQEERHTVLQLGRDDRTVQKTLQWLEGELRKGRQPADARVLRQATIQCVDRPDVKVKRWALNVLAELGIAGRLEILDSVFPHVADDPDLLASAVRLLFSEARQGAGLKLLNQKGVAVEGLALIAGSEYSVLLRKRLIDERIPLDNASAEELRAAIVLTGRGKAPEYLFLERHPNQIAISELNLHDDPAVVKYSLWGMAELKMGFSFLKIDLCEYDACEPQVRKWILRLLFSDERALAQNIDLIWHGAQDEDVNVREEAAIGLRNCYVEGACADILRWYRTEEVEAVSHALLDHFANFAVRNSIYAGIVKEVYAAQRFRSELRGRIEAAVAGTEIYRQLRVIELKEESVSLFSNDNDLGGILMPKIEQHFPNAQIGAVTAEGSVSINSQNFVQGPSAEMIDGICALIVKVAGLTASESTRREGEEIALELKRAPSKGLVERALGWVKAASAGASASAELIHAGGDLISQLDSVSSMF